MHSACGRTPAQFVQWVVEPRFNLAKQLNKWSTCVKILKFVIYHNNKERKQVKLQYWTGDKFG